VLLDSIRLHSHITTALVLNDGALVANCMSTLDGVMNYLSQMRLGFRLLFQKLPGCSQLAVDPVSPASHFLTHNCT